MALGKYNRRTVSQSSGQVVAGAIVKFYVQETGLPAMLYNDAAGLDPIGTSITSGDNGEVEVFLNPGRYRITVEVGGDVIEEITYEPVVGDMGFVNATDVGFSIVQEDTPASTSFLQVYSTGLTATRTLAQTRTDLKQYLKDLQFASIADISDASGPTLVDGTVLTTADLAEIADTGKTGSLSAYDNTSIFDGGKYEFITDAERISRGLTANAWTCIALFGDTDYYAVFRSSGRLSTSTYGDSLQDAIDASLVAECIHIDGEVAYDETIDWKGRRHETADLPLLINSVAITGGNLGARMTVADGMLYSCSYSAAAINVFSLKDPRNPAQITSISVGSQPRHVDVFGRHLFVCCHGADEIQIYDISNPAAAGLVGTIPTGDQPKMFELIGNEIYVVCYGSSTIEKYVYQVPSETTGFTYYQVATVGVASGPLCCAFNGAGVLAVCGLTTSNVNLVGSSTMNLISTTAIGGAGHGTCVFINKTQLLVTDATNHRVYSVDCSSLSTPTVSSFVTTTTAPEQIEIIGNRAYVPSLTNPGVTSYVTAIDITNPQELYAYKDVELTVTGGGFTAHYEYGDACYLYVNGHFSPYNIDVLEVVKGGGDKRPLNVHENLYARTAGVAKLDAGLNSVYQAFVTKTAPYTATHKDNIIRVGTGDAIALPDPSTMRGKQLTVVNVDGSLTSDVTNAYSGFSGTLAAGAAVTVIAGEFGGGYQWDAISSHGTIT